MQPRVIIWDNDGTIMDSKDPNDKSNAAKVILPNVEKVMRQDNICNVICSGTKTPESESQNYDPSKVIVKFKELMIRLPVEVAIFSPAMGGTECWIIIKKNNAFEIRKAHEDKRYKHLIGQFKKPESGMFIVIKDLLEELFGCAVNVKDLMCIGDSQQDKIAAQTLGIPFIWAAYIHQLPDGLSI